MASLRKFKSSPFWYACFTDSQGGRVQLSTKETRRSVAQRIADAWERAAKKEVTLERANWIMTDLAEGVAGRRRNIPTLLEFCQEWLSRRKGETAHSTILVYEKAVERLVQELGQEKLNNISESSLVLARNANAEKLSASTVNRDVKIWRMIFSHALDRRWIDRNPVKGIRPIKGQDIPRRRPFTVEEIHKVLSIADDEWRSMILFGLYTGQRLGDIAGLRRDSVDLGCRVVRIKTRKTGKELEIPLAEPIFEFLRSRQLSDPIHPRALETTQRQNGRTGNLSNQFGDILAYAGLREYARHVARKSGRSARRDPTTLSFHCLRHTCNTWLEEAGVPRAVIMEIIGHDDIQSGRHYTHVGKAATQMAIKTLPNIIDAQSS